MLILSLVTNDYFNALWVLGILLIAVVVIIAIRLSKRPVVKGLDSLEGMKGEAITGLDPHGQVRIMGEIWKAQTAGSSIEKGSIIRVLAEKGLTLEVEKIDKEQED